MMEHYTTQATNAHNLWLQGLQELALRQVRARDMAGETEKYKKPELYTAEVNRLWLQGLRELALRQARERDMSKPQAQNLGKTLHGMWQHFVQGWELIFTPLPHQQDYPGTEAQQKPSKEAPEKEIDDSEFRAASVEVAENNQEIWASFRGSSEIKRSEEAREKQETHDHSAAGTGEWERPQWMKCGTEIRPEEPILRTELSRDDLILTEKEFPSSGIEAKTESEAPARDHRGAWKTFLKGSEMEEEEEQEKRENKEETGSFSKQGAGDYKSSQDLRGGMEINPEARAFIERNEKRKYSSIEQNDLSEAPILTARKEEKEHLFDGNHYRELSSYQTGEHLFRGQDFLPEAPIISPGAKEMENSFDDEDLRKKPPGEKMLGEGQRSFLKDDGYHEQVPKMRVSAQARDYPSNSQNWPTKAPEIERLDEIEERLFGNEGQSNYQTGEDLSREDRLLAARKIKEFNEGKERSFGNEGPSNCQGIEHLFNGEVLYLEGTRSKVSDQMVESSFKEEDRWLNNLIYSSLMRSLDPQKMVLGGLNPYDKREKFLFERKDRDEKLIKRIFCKKRKINKKFA